MDPPPVTRRDDIVEVLHGVPVADPYRWLEDQTAADVVAWVADQQAATRHYLDGLGDREEIRRQLRAVWDYPKAGVPWRRADRWFQFRNDGLQQQSVLWTSESPTAAGRPLLDPLELNPDGTVSLAGTAVTPDGRLLAYGTSDGGSDWITWRVRDVVTGQDTRDVGRWGKFSGAAWSHDQNGFFYGAFAPPSDAPLSQRNDNHRLHYLRLGRPGEPDLVYARPDEPLWGFSPHVSEDGRWLVVTISTGTDPRNRIYLGDLTAVDDPAAVRLDPWLDDFDAAYSVVGNDEDTFFVRTDLDAPRGRMMAVQAGDATVRSDILAETADPMVAVRYVAGRFVVVRMVDATHRLAVHERDGTLVVDVELPGLVSISGISGRQRDNAAHLSASSFTSSPTLYRLDVPGAPALTSIRAAAVDLPGVVTEQVVVDSTDGARVPLFLIRPTTARPDRTNRTMLYGYGGFDIPLTPEFRLWWSVWLQRGGIVAVGCYRGGGEYGRAWHDAGRLADKRHTFDDALACARWLDQSGWAAPANLAITGGSNGGLTATATMLRSPRSFGACVPEVGTLDLLRFHKFTIGWAWTSDFGDPDDPDDFARLREMSPYHTVLDAPGEYPATLVTTADRDDRVVPAHSFKFVAAMQAAQRGTAPVLARIDTRAGHGSGTPTAKLIDARADVLAFLEDVLPGGAAVGVSDSSASTTQT